MQRIQNDTLRYDNDTEAYIGAVTKRMGVRRDAVLDWHDKGVMVALVVAMAVVECGRELQESLVAEGYELAAQSFALHLK